MWRARSALRADRRRSSGRRQATQRVGVSTRPGTTAARMEASQVGAEREAVREPVQRLQRGMQRALPSAGDPDHASCTAALHRLRLTELEGDEAFLVQATERRVDRSDGDVAARARGDLAPDGCPVGILAEPRRRAEDEQLDLAEESLNHRLLYNIHEDISIAPASDGTVYRGEERARKSARERAREKERARKSARERAREKRRARKGARERAREKERLRRSGRKGCGAPSDSAPIFQRSFSRALSSALFLARCFSRALWHFALSGTSRSLALRALWHFAPSGTSPR